MPTYQSIDSFLTEASAPILDVRSPKEFLRGHIPGAINLPLFDDQQREEVGTLYKRNGRVASIQKALRYIQPKMVNLTDSAKNFAVDDCLRVHCWRGGMRSRSTAWLFEKIDLRPTVLQGGYKSFRRHVIDSFKTPLNLIVLSGLTGSGKTRQLQVLKGLGEQVLDLEALANHRGSAFGGIGLGDQPTVEHFENQLHDAIGKLDANRVIWVEDESRNVGNIRLPHHFFDQLRAAPALFLQCSREVRVDLIMQDYGAMPSDQLIAATRRIGKRIGGLCMKQAIALIESGRIHDGIEILLDYYDKLYLQNKSKMKRKTFIDVPAEDPVSQITGRRLIQLSRETTQ